MSTSEVSPETPLDKGQRAEAAIPTNVRVYLGLSGKTQKALGEALGITKSAMSMKMCGKVGWSVSDLVTTADFLGVTPSALMDDTILSKAEAGYAKSAEYGVFAEKPGALVGAGSRSRPSSSSGSSCMRCDSSGLAIMSLFSCSGCKVHYSSRGSFRPAACMS